MSGDWAEKPLEDSFREKKNPCFREDRKQKLDSFVSLGDQGDYFLVMALQGIKGSRLMLIAGMGRDKVKGIAFSKNRRPGGDRQETELPEVEEGAMVSMCSGKEDFHG